jgi:hypothetical protein
MDVRAEPSSAALGEQSHTAISMAKSGKQVASELQRRLDALRGPVPEAKPPSAGELEARLQEFRGKQAGDPLPPSVLQARLNTMRAGGAHSVAALPVEDDSDPAAALLRQIADSLALEGDANAASVAKAAVEGAHGVDTPEGGSCEAVLEDADGEMDGIVDAQVEALMEAARAGRLTDTD